jgi:uncharacterized cupin superfamily protein
MEQGVSFARLELETSERFVTLRRTLGITTFGLNQIKLRPGQRGRIHEHENQEEVFLVLEGTLSLGLDGEERDLGAGELVRVGPQVRRQLVNRGPGDCVLLALGGANPHEGRDATAYVSWEATEGAAPQETPLPEDLPEEELRGA